MLYSTQWVKEANLSHASSVISKDPRPEDVALICPQKGLIDFELKFIVYWSSGVMELWKNQNLGPSWDLRIL